MQIKSFLMALRLSIRAFNILFYFSDVHKTQLRQSKCATFGKQAYLALHNRKIENEHPGYPRKFLLNRGCLNSFDCEFSSRNRPLPCKVN